MPADSSNRIHELKEKLELLEKALFDIRELVCEIEDPRYPMFKRMILDVCKDTGTTPSDFFDFVSQRELPDPERK